MTPTHDDLARRFGEGRIDAARTLLGEHATGDPESVPRFLYAEHLLPRQRALLATIVTYAHPAWLRELDDLVKSGRVDASGNQVIGGLLYALRRLVLTRDDLDASGVHPDFAALSAPEPAAFTTLGDDADTDTRSGWLYRTRSVPL